jgi:hypothetical protein
MEDRSKGNEKELSIPEKQVETDDCLSKNKH